MKCAKSARYCVTHGNNEVGPIIPTRGIRQGDPLSLYLFILCAECFTTLLRKYEQKGWLHGCKEANGALRVSHMLFADDSYLYCKATEDEALRIQEVLLKFELASGQKVNFSKSSIFFRSNTLSSMKDRINSILGMVTGAEGSLYLGLPSSMGRNKSVALGFLKNKVKNRLLGYGTKFLSRVGKEILIKTAAQALPSYAMSVFLIPQEVTRDIEGLMSNFWWQSSSNSPKGWRLLTKPDTLVSGIFKARYYPRGSFFTADIGNNPSYVWRSVLEARQLVLKGVCWTVGDDTSISVLSEPWLPDTQNSFVSSSHPALVGAKVCNLLAMDGSGWDEDVVADLFEQRDQSLILGILGQHDHGRDKLTWIGEIFDFYTVKSAYRMAQEMNGWNTQDTSVLEAFWKKF
ncbi:hypothetical protein CsatB_017572 [Cannabis sativa]|uniref:uncharacterized protein LOC115710585 n=1 Tax=Cannabis sativa TaxID=3483 RepID=UPI0029CA1393|nr:uncharacterized protein LOC115710585 [Cannabis sativa]